MSEASGSTVQSTFSDIGKGTLEDEGLLRHLYVSEGLSHYKIADEYSVEANEVKPLLRKYGILRPEQVDFTEAELREAYESQNSISGVMGALSTYREKVIRHMNHYDIQRNDGYSTAKRRELDLRPVRLKSQLGYERWSSSDGIVLVHRLVAVAEYGFDAVAGMDVHHKNGVKWDNRPSNLSIMGRAEHQREHWQSSDLESLLAETSFEEAVEAIKQSGKERILDDSLR